MNKHTPGPWYPVATQDGMFVFKDVKDERHKIAELFLWGEETEHNARLIAAAPEMLEALQVAYAELENHKGVPGVVEHVLPAIEAAIAKAEGR